MTAERSPVAGLVQPRLALATGNGHKVAELTRILAAAGVGAELADLTEFPGAPDVAETGATFTENALLKARSLARFTGLPAIADDSGLCVDALNGMPGVLSARWAGGHGDDQANLRLVLAQIADLPDDRRRAQFTCAAALVLPSGEGGVMEQHLAEGIVRGTLIREPRGTGGFGYDPIFVPDPAELAAADDSTALAGLTTAQMSPEAKDAISHRGRALRALVPYISRSVMR